MPVPPASNDGFVPAVLVVRNAVIQEQATGPQHAHDGFRIGTQICQTDVLKHADAGD